MPMRITGLSSGLDTESIVTELTKVQSNKVTKVKSDQKKHDMRMDKWKDLNKKVVSFYNKTLSNMRFDSSFIKKTTTASNNDAVSVTTSGSAMNSAQKMSVDKLASSAYLTGGKLKSKSGELDSSTTLEYLNEYSSAPSTRTIKAKNLDGTYSDKEVTDDDFKGKVRIKFGKAPESGEDTREFVDVEINANESIAEAIAKLKDAKVGDKDNPIGINANFDSKQGRIFVSANATGADNGFEIDFDHSDMRIVSALGLDYNDNTDSHFDTGEDAEITLNGVKYTSDTNTFDINGLSITAKQKAEDITLTTADDTSGVYKMIKDFLSEYNDLVGEMAEYYNADDAKEYDILTAEQKEQMTDEEIDEWNEKIEKGLLSKDPIIGRVMREMKSIMLGAFDLGDTDKDGKPVKTSFSTFGIHTLSYFNTEENDRGKWHIDGDEDDENTGKEEDKLTAAISKNPDLVRNFFKNISSNLYSKLGDLMKSTDFSSSFTLYEDKKMKTQVDKYKKQLKSEQDKLTALEDKYYDQFTQMEKAMTNLNSQQSQLSGMIGS